jgi:splicing factor 3A subunit 1
MSSISDRPPLGVIIPPPEVKKLIDKAAALTAKYGSSIENLMQKEERNLPKFSFLKEGDPYRGYYDFKCGQIAVNKTDKVKGEESLLGKKRSTIETNPIQNKTIQDTSKKMKTQEDLRKFMEDKKVEKMQNEIDLSKPPPSDQFSINHPNNISSLDADIIKTTALFVSRNGQKFLTALLEREGKNPQFDFLKPQHHMFGYFVQYVDIYKNLLTKTHDAKLESYASDKDQIMKAAMKRYLYEKKQKENLKKKDQISEQERQQMQMIDWYDFVIVENIDFTPEELANTIPLGSSGNYNPNMNVTSYESNINLLMNKMHLQIPSHEIESNKPKEPLPEPGMKIVQNYKKPSQQDTLNLTQQKCPLCGLMILNEEFEEHIKIELVDPKWKEIHKELNERKIEVNLSGSNEFMNYLGEFSKNRPDLFGDIKDVTKVEQQQRSEANVKSVIWDGVAPNMSRTTANIAMMAMQTRKNIEESIRLKGEGKDNSNIGPGVVLNPQLQAQQNQGQGKVPDNLNKIQQNNSQISSEIGENDTNSSIKETTLIPEEQWLKKNSNPVMLEIKIPNYKNSQMEDIYNLKGQVMRILIKPKDTIFAVKSELSKNLMDFPLGNMSLKLGNEELIDEKTVAYYNLNNSVILELSIK